MRRLKRRLDFQRPELFDDGNGGGDGGAFAVAVTASGAIVTAHIQPSVAERTYRYTYIVVYIYTSES